MIFTYIVTALLIALSMSVLGKEFPYVPFYISASFLGLGVSFWQQKKHPIPYLRILTNVIFILLTIKALFPFFRLTPKHDMFTALLETWIYFLIIAAFIIYKKRDFYIVQGLSLGLIIYACFYAVNNPFILFNVSVCFLAIWMMGLRALNLLPEGKKQEDSISGIANIWREIKVGSVLFIAVFVISIPFYFLIPRLNIPLLPLDFLLKQRYSAIYADFPKRGLVTFLSRTPLKMTEERKSEGKTSSPHERGSELQLETAPQTLKPIFWSSRQDAQDLLKEIEQTNQELRDLGQQNNLPDIEKNMQEQQRQEHSLNRVNQELENQISETKEEYQRRAAAARDAQQAQQEGTGSVEEAQQRQEAMKAVETGIQKLVNEQNELNRQLERTRENIQEIQSQASQPQQVAIQALQAKKEALVKELVALIKKIKDLQPEEQKQALIRQDAQDLLKEIEKTNQELRDLGQQNNLADIEKNMQEWQTLKENEEALTWAKQELENQISQTKEEYLNLVVANAAQPAQEGGEGGEATKQPEETMKAAEIQMQTLIDGRRELDGQLEKIREKMQEIRNNIQKQARLAQQPMLQVLWEKKETLENKLAALIEEIKKLPPEEQKQAPEKKPEPKKAESLARGSSKRRINILDIILYLLILIVASYVIRLMVVLFVPIIMHKRRIRKALCSKEHNLAISLIYNFFCRLFSFFGYKYPVEILPEDYLAAVRGNFAHLAHDIEILTALFIEARYSAHPLSPKQEEEALNCYRVILHELKNRGAFWQRQILKVGFLFEV